MRCLICLKGDSTPTVITVDVMSYDDAEQSLWISTVGGDYYTIKMSSFAAKCCINDLYLNGSTSLTEYESEEYDADEY